MIEKVSNSKLKKVSGGNSSSHGTYKVTSNKETIHSIASYLQVSVSYLHKKNPGLIQYQSDYIPIGTKIEY